MFKHKPPMRPQHCPNIAPLCSFDTDAQLPVPHNTQPQLPLDRIRQIQQIVGTIMYYAHAVDITTLVALSSTATK